MKVLVCIVYDSIGQAVFESQVLLPLIKRSTEEKYEKVLIVSFEATFTQELKTRAKAYEEQYLFLQCVLFKRSRFICSITLWKEALELRSLLVTFSSYTLIARGPFAGVIAQRAITKRCINYIVQARGLVAQEYAYAHRYSSGFSRILFTLRFYQLQRLEKEGYLPPHNTTIPFSIETVSPALQKYLTTTYHLNSPFTATQFDTPVTICPEEKKSYRTAIRKKYKISLDAPVYVYNGSLKTWQCPYETIERFKEYWLQNSASIFLALTPDTKEMLSLLAQANLPSSAYRVAHIPHSQMLATLCAADYGFLLREPHSINWVSRPTKLLEYEAIGLQVIHNHTIELLSIKKEIE